MADHYEDNPNGEQSARRFSSQFSDTAKAATSKAKQDSESMAARVTEVTSLFGRNIREMADLIRDHSPQNFRRQTDPLATNLQRAGTYLEEKSFDAIADDVAHVIRKYPMQCLVAGVVLGILLSRRREND
jgi:hypothetical protein